MLTEIYIDILFIFVAMLVIVLLLGNYELKQQRAQKIRDKLLNKIYSLRILKMLLFLGIDINKYVAKIPPKSILKLIITCQVCRNTAACDSCLRDGKPFKSLCFCPNIKALNKQSKALHTR